VIKMEQVNDLKGATSPIPDGITQIGTIIKYELINYFRSKRFYILLAIGLIISLLLTILIAYYRPVSFLGSDLLFYSGWWGSTITFVIILSAIFFGGDSISGEFQNKTGYYIASRPVRRSSLYIGKWVAAFIASIIIIVIFLAITIINGVYYFGLVVPNAIIDSFAFAILYLASVLGFAFFFSSLFKSSSYSILITVILFLFVFTLLQDLISSLVKIQPWFIITYGSSIITNIFLSPYPPVVSTATRFGATVTTYTASLNEGIIIMLGYFIISVVLGLLIFERREFN
jgi:ABC-2 type transport system permease protein